MKFPVLSFKCLSAQARLFSLLLTYLALAPASVFARETPKPTARPVARLISTSRQETPQRERTRVVTAYRAAPTAPVPVPTATSSELRLLELVNRERRERGLRPLVWDGALSRMARYHSDNMARQGFFNHVDHQGLDLSGRAELLAIRGWGSLAENIAYNQGFDDPEAFAVERWMISSKHRENILNGEFTHAGLGIARGSDGRVYFTQVFMRR